MRITKICIKNFKGLTNVSLEELGDMVIIAGANGSGKSCVFDAVRLLKSAYGGYTPNEWQTWFGEFNINVHNQATIVSDIFQNKSSELLISASFKLSPSEIEFLRASLPKLVREQIWKVVAPESAGWRYMSAMPLASNLRVHEDEVERRLSEELPIALASLEEPEIEGEIKISISGQIKVKPSRILELLFGTFEPEKIGIIDYYGPNRTYNREYVQGINLNIGTTDDQRRQSALYNHNAKYNNLKTEIASSYVKHLLAKEAGLDEGYADTLTDTLKELFSTFFPGKTFLGPQPTTNGTLNFNVKVGETAIHDINELSSGEKEIVYGYLRLRNSTPNNSILLLDEPELHLNPRLIKGLAQFYHKHLSKTANNQIWMVTHSDALIRDSVGNADFKVYHMQPTSMNFEENQAIEVNAKADIENVVIDLVGDLAAYRPGSKMVIFEGGGDTEFDVTFVSQLFPEFSKQVNLISAGHKGRVKELYELLEKAREIGALPAKFYSITDADIEIINTVPAQTRASYTWNVYHIENYLLEPTFIKQVIDSLHLNDSPLNSIEDVDTKLRECAIECIDELIQIGVQDRINSSLKRCFDFGYNPRNANLSLEMSNAIIRTQSKLQASMLGELSQTNIENMLNKERQKLQDSISDGSWKQKIPGRNILRKFVGKFGNSTGYKVVRNQIIGRMKDSSFQPEGMKIIIDQISND